MANRKAAAKAAPASPKIVSVEAKVELVSFAVSAVIPTQQYGNIQPRIEVRGPSIEAARAVAMPAIEELYRAYAETPLSGKNPRFYGNVTEEVKVVVPAADQLRAPHEVVTPKSDGPVIGATDVPFESSKPAAGAKPEAVLKAEKAISLAVTDDALNAIQGQIERSVKIDRKDKPALYVLVRDRFKHTK